MTIMDQRRLRPPFSPVDPKGVGDVIPHLTERPASPERREAVEEQRTIEDAVRDLDDVEP
jgi:hypothetical protein